MDYFIGALKKYADFNGRASRQEYWMFILIYFVFAIVLAVLDALLGIDILSIIYTVGLFIPHISIGARRLHDTGRSGWWQLIVLVPIIGFIVLIVFLAQNSRDENDYGVTPKVDVSI